MNELEKKINKILDEKGKMTFAEYMNMALYEPDLGYYQKQNPFGTQGSFYTSVNASSSFGRGVANSIAYMFKQLSISSCICEMGAGSGMLANDILTWFKTAEPEIYENLTYTIIEKSGYLIERQKELLSEFEGKVCWKSFDELENFNGVFFSNELVDAFPVHRVIRINDEIKELYLIKHESSYTYYPDKISTEEILTYLERIGLKLVHGQIADINLDSISWMQDLSGKLDKAVVLTIDYGYPAPQLFSSHRRDGTVTCYYQHRQNNDFFENMGDQDITAFVDFTTLEIVGGQNGLEKVALMPQWLFMIQSGILEDIRKAGTDLEKASVKSLIMPEGGFGTNFHALIQAKGISIPSDFKFYKKAADTFGELAEIYKDLDEPSQ